MPTSLRHLAAVNTGKAKAKEMAPRRAGHSERDQANGHDILTQSATRGATPELEEEVVPASEERPGTVDPRALMIEDYDPDAYEEDEEEDDKDYPTLSIHGAVAATPSPPEVPDENCLIFIVFRVTFTTLTPPRLRGNAIMAFSDVPSATTWTKNLIFEEHPKATYDNSASSVGIAPKSMRKFMVVREPTRRDGTTVSHAYWIEECEMLFDIKRDSAKRIDLR